MAKGRVVKIGDRTVIDYTPATIFPSNPVINQRDVPEHQVCSFDDIQKYVHSDSIKKTELTGIELKLTQKLRQDEKRLSRVYNMQALHQKPMALLRDFAMFPLPLNHEKSLPDWLTTTSQAYIDLVIMIADQIMKSNPTPEEEAAARTLLIDYGASAPFASVLRHSDHMRSENWEPHRLKMISDLASDILMQNFKNAASNLEHYSPPLNPTKSTGWNKRRPNGLPYVKSDYAYVPASLTESDDLSKVPNNIYRYDNGPFKLEWFRSEEFFRRLEFFLNNCDRYDNEDIFLEAFDIEMLAVALEAYRINNADPVKNEWSGSFRGDLGHFYKKDRDIAFEHGEGILFEALINDEKLMCAIHKKDPKRLLGVLKKRPMFPHPNAIFSVAFIFLFRLLLKDLEESAVGLPSLAPESQQGFKDYYSITQGMGGCVVGLDRRTFEQWVTCHWDLFLQALPDWLRPIMKGLGITVLPSVNGPRVVCGGLISGAPPTSFTSMFICFVTKAFIYPELFEVPFEQTAKLLFCKVLGEKQPYIELGDWFVKEHMGSDDITIIFKHKRWSSDDVKRMLDDFFSEYCPKHFMTYESSTDYITSFGLNIGVNSCSVASTLGLGKLFLMEKTLNGDAAAFKMWSRLSLLPKYYPIIEKAFHDLGFGDISTYKVGANNFKNILVKFGYEVEGLVNEHSPVDRLILGSAFKEFNIDPTQYAKRYPVDGLTRIYTMFDRKFNKR